MSWLLLVLACSRPDPELVAQRDAIARWREGVSALEAGDPAAARAHFQAARELRPHDGLLLGWEASAAAEAGDLDVAIELSGQALAEHPGMAEVRYDRAAWLARAGRVEEAAPELARALKDGGASPDQVLDDADFVEHLGHPSFGFLPRAAPEAVLEVPEGSVFWGSQATIRLSVRGRGELEVQGALTGPVELVSGVVRFEGGNASVAATQEWAVVVRGAGVVTVGPLVARVGGQEVEVPEARFEALAPPDKPGPGNQTLDLPWAPALRAGLELPGVRAGEGELVALVGHQAKVAIEPAAGTRQQFDEWRDGEPMARVHRWVGVPPGTYTVVAREGAKEVLREQAVVTGRSDPG